MLKLIKEAQKTNEDVSIIVENCTKYGVSKDLLESLDGLMTQYARDINGGQMRQFDYGNVSELANIFAFAELLGAMGNKTTDPGAARAIINLYRKAKPGVEQTIVNLIYKIIDHLDPGIQQQFKQNANSWGNMLSHTLRSPTPENMKEVASALVGTAARLNTAMRQFEQNHTDVITKHRIQQTNAMKPAMAPQQRPVPRR